MSEDLLCEFRATPTRRSLALKTKRILFTALITIVVLSLQVTAINTPAASAAATAVDVDDNAQSGTNHFAFSGTSWVSCGSCNRGAYAGGFRYAYVTGAKATLSFTGTKVKLYGYKEPVGGIAAVSIDGAPSTDVDYYAATQTLGEVFSSPVLPSRPHTVTITVTGRKAAGRSPTINIDRASVQTDDVAAVPSGTATPSSTPISPPTIAPRPTVSVTPRVSDGAGRSWMSGGSGDGIGNGAFANWRGSPVPVAVTWSDNTLDNAVNSYQFDPGAEYGNWTGSADWSPGGIWAGDSWSAAASGAYDAKWSQLLTNVKKKWSAKSRGTLYIRFAHEMNGDWFKHRVSPGDVKDFIAAWRRFYNLKEQIFPSAKMTFNTNGNTVRQAYDWRTLWPGDKYVDVYSTDWYSNHWVLGGAYDSYGAPQGLEQHRLFAQQHGKPFAVPEWGNNTDNGDQPKYIQYMYDFFSANGGKGAGNVLYEAYFNVTWSPNQFGVFPQSGSLAPQSAAKYRELF